MRSRCRACGPHCATWTSGWIRIRAVPAALLGVIARAPALSPIVARFARYGMAFARILGSSEGILAYEVEGEAGERRSVVFTGHESFLMAAIPAALAAMRLASGEPCPAGVVPVHQHVGVGALGAALTRHGIRIEQRETSLRL